MKKYSSQIFVNLFPLSLALCLAVTKLISAENRKTAERSAARQTDGQRAAGATKGSVSYTNYHGWSDSLLLSNGNVETVIVPAVGRVMQFRFVGEDGPFWENEKMIGKSSDPKSKEWGNFGGDKTWPAPQADWGRVAERDWPPPPAFDSMPVTAIVSGTVVTLVSPVDPFYGIRTERRIQLVPGKPTMTIGTTYEKVNGNPGKVGVWIITHLFDSCCDY